jgi:hypothetical protein
MDNVEALKREARNALSLAKASWRENDRRLIWCGYNGDGTFKFCNTTSATRAGPTISEAEAARYLSEEGPWRRPSAA